MAQILKYFKIILIFFIVSSCSHKSVQIKSNHDSNSRTTPQTIENKDDVNQKQNINDNSTINKPEDQNAGLNPSQVAVDSVSAGYSSNLNTKSLPKFGFIFSGGGAKAWAHIGVLKELQKFKWPIHSVAGFEWGSVVAATYAQNLSPNEVEWEMSKLKEFDKYEGFVKTVFEKKSTSDLKIPFVCPSLNISKQSYFLLNRGLLPQLIPFCLAQPPVTEPYSQSVAVMSDVSSLAQHLRSTGANRIILVNVLAQQKMRSFVNDYKSAENILWVQSAALMSRKPNGVDEIMQINLDDYGIKDLDKRREIIAKGSELSYDQIKKLAQKYGL